MVFFPRAKRIVVAFVAAIVAVCVVGLLGIQIQQRVLRHRAERLVADFQDFISQPRTFEQAEQFRSKWAKWQSVVEFGNHHGCTVNDCVFAVSLRDLALGHLYLLQKPWRARLYTFLGGRPAEISAQIEIKNGVVSNESLNAGIFIFDRLGRLYPTLARASMDPVLLSMRRPQPGVPYVIHNENKCWTCLFVDFGPEISASDRKRLVAFDLSCFTGFELCRDGSQMMPNAWAEYVSNEEAACSSHEDEYIRAARTVGIFEVLDVGLDGYGQLASTRLDQLLKGKSEFHVGSTWLIYGSEPVSLHPMRRGMKLIVALEDIYPKDGGYLGAVRCGTMLANDDNLQRVQWVIAEEIPAAPPKN